MNRIKKTQCSHKDCSGRGDVIFRKVSIPSVFGDELTGSMKPENGAYKNALVFYEASGVSFLYDSDGVYTKIANIEGEAGVISINGKQGVVTITLAELGGMTESQINSLITSKGYQTAAQVDVKVSTAKAGAIAESKTYTDIKIAQVESEIPAKTSDLVNDSNFQTSAQVDTKVAAEATARATAITAVRNEIPDVVDNVTSTSTTNALSAKQGKLLNDRITNIDSRGRYLSTWDTTTGEPGTEPEVIPYAYRTGDYFIVSTVGATNYRPTGSQYTGAASTVVETDTVSPNDTYLYDGTTWELIHTEIPQIAIDENLSTTSRNAVWNSTITNALGDKVDKVTGKQLSTEDYTTAEKNKLAGLENTVLESTTGQSTTAGMTQKAITDALASAGGVKVLTTADYNWPTSNPNGVAFWLLPNGVYSATGDVYMYCNNSNKRHGVFIIDTESNSTHKQFVQIEGSSSSAIRIGKISVRTLSYEEFNVYAPVDTLTSNESTKPLSANQGKVLKDLIDSLIIKGSGTPTTATVGTVGQLYEDTTNGDLYQCTAVSGSTYTWEEVGGGGGGVQFTDIYNDGTSKTKVQLGAFADASGTTSVAIGGATSRAFATAAGNAGAVAIGAGATVYSDYSAAIGTNSSASQQYSVAMGCNTAANGQFSGAIGSYSKATQKGEISFGDPNQSIFYDNTGYRLLTNVHDPVSDHDAATKKYVDEHSGGGGGDVSFTDLFTDGSTQTQVKIGANAQSSNFATVAIGGGTTDAAKATRSGAVAIGKGASATGQDAIAIHATVAGNTSVAIGKSANVLSAGSVAIGSDAFVGANNYGVSIGLNASCYGSNSVALGSNSYVDSVEQGVVSIGGANLGTGGYNNTQYRLLTNVHDGVNAHDAVNKQQLDAALAQITALEARIAALEGNA